MLSHTDLPKILHLKRPKFKSVNEVLLVQPCKRKKQNKTKKWHSFNHDKNSFDHDWQKSNWRSIGTLAGVVAVVCGHYFPVPFWHFPEQRSEQEWHTEDIITNQRMEEKPNYNCSGSWTFWSKCTLEVIFIMVLWGALHIFISDFFFFSSLLGLEKKRHRRGAGSAENTAFEKERDHCGLHFHANRRTYNASPEEAV